MMDNVVLLFAAPSLILQIMLDGVLIGAIFALVAYGLALVWGVMNLINIAQGEFVMLGGFVTYYISLAGFSPLYGIPIAAAILFVVGWTLYKAVVFRIVERDFFVSILATFGISIVIQQLSNQLFGADIVTAESGMGSVFLLDNMVVVPWIKIVGFGAAFIVGLALYLFLKNSRLGQAIRATSQNPRAARILGVDTDRVFAFTFAINAAICGAAGALVAMTWFIHPYAGHAFTVRSFMIVILAGLGNLINVGLTGLGLGAMENYFGFIIGAEFQNAFVFVLLVIILVWRNFKLARKREYLK